jgi:hypothetical protein
MKNSKIIVLLFLSGIYQSVAFGQGVYLELNSGYSLSTASQNLGSNSSSTYSNGVYTGTEENVVGSLGKGLNVGFKIGYQFSENFALDIQTDYLFGAEYKSESSENFSYDFDGDTYSELYNFNSNYSAKMLRINPAVVFEVSKNKLSPYARLGVVLGMGQINGSYGYNYTESYPDFMGGQETYTSSEEVATKLSGGLSIGASAELGLKVAISEKLSFIGGIKMNGMSFAPTRGEITRYTSDGIDITSQLTTSEREAEFVNEIDYSSSSQQDDNKPSKELKSFYAFSSVGLSVGIRFSL